jgi:hypothetical protein
MVRKKQQPGSALRMYRHFAVITVALTMALAMLADGESRAALAEEIAEREQRNMLAHASAEKFGRPKLINKAPAATAGSFGSDSGDFGEPMDDAGGGNPSGFIPDYDPDAGPAYAPAAYGRFGLSEAEWDALSEDHRAELLRQLQADAALAAAPERQRQIESLAAASRSRSGRSAELD